MGVNHLRRDASAVEAGTYRGNTHGSPQAEQVSSGPDFKRPPSTSGDSRHVPQVGSVNSFDSKSVHPGNSAPQPPKGAANGGRAGSKSSQERLGSKTGNTKGMSGGRMA